MPFESAPGYMGGEREVRFTLIWCANGYLSCFGEGCYATSTSGLIMYRGKIHCSISWIELGAVWLPPRVLQVPPQGS